jgi:hypothetical protein
MKTLPYTSLLLLIGLVLLAVSTTAGDYQLVKDVLSTSGGRVASTNYRLDYSTGQVAVGKSVGTTDTETGGFWTWSLWVDVEPGVEEQAPGLVPGEYVLFQNFPNPFNPETTISYRLPRAGYVSLAVFNVAGQEVCHLVNGEQAVGEHVVIWDGTDGLGGPVASGIYFYQLICGEFCQVRKMLLLK